MSNKENYRCKKIRSGKYEYRGWVISCVGYYEPDQKICWEAYDPITWCADYLGFSKREIKLFIDADLEKQSKPPTCSHYFPATRTGYMDCEFCGEKHKSNKS